MKNGLNKHRKSCWKALISLAIVLSLFSSSFALGQPNIPEIEIPIEPIFFDEKEILYFEDVPKGVSINEAVELAKKYSTEESSKFINGILGQAANVRSI